MHRMSPPNATIQHRLPCRSSGVWHGSGVPPRPHTEQSINGCGRCHTGIHARDMRNLRVASHTRIAAGVTIRTSAALLCHTRTTRRRTCHTPARATNDIRSTRTNLEAGTQCQAAGTQSAMELPVAAGSGGAGLHIASGMGCRAPPTKLSCN
jgi:hypothetical protein